VYPVAACARGELTRRSCRDHVIHTAPKGRQEVVAVLKVMLDAEAGQVSEELVRRGIAADTRVRVLAEVVENDEGPSMAALAQAGGAFAFLAEEPDLYSDADAVERNG
jgi:hypothetical protein